MVEASTGNQIVSIMTALKTGQSNVDHWLTVLSRPEFKELLSHCGYWDEGRRHQLSPDRFLYLLQNALAGQGAFSLPPRQVVIQRHLERAYDRLEQIEEALIPFQEYLEQNLASTLAREVTPWLPTAVNLDCRVQLTLGTDQIAFVGESIWLDMLGALELGLPRIEQYVAHELFHQGHRQLAIDLAGGQNDVLFGLLFALQTEGVANHVIGGAREIIELRYKYSHGTERQQLLNILDNYARFAREQEQLLALMFDKLTQALTGEEAALRWLRSYSPGHYQGVAMAAAIEAALGQEALIDTLAHPEDFVLVYGDISGQVPHALAGNLRERRRRRQNERKQ